MKNLDKYADDAIYNHLCLQVETNKNNLVLASDNASLKIVTDCGSLTY